MTMLPLDYKAELVIWYGRATVDGMTNLMRVPDSDEARRPEYWVGRLPADVDFAIHLWGPGGFVVLVPYARTPLISLVRSVPDRRRRRRRWATMERESVASLARVSCLTTGKT